MTVNFLDALNADERHALTSMTEERTFARGTKPIREGDPADYVMVITSGRTQISVHDNGRDRIIAERGPGQLVGELGALRVDARSATVTALETVRALVMKTEDFAGFLSAHSRVLAIVEGQIDASPAEDPPGTEGNKGNGWNGLPGAVPLREVPQSLPWVPRRRSLSGENCTVVLTDVVGFGAHERNDRDRLIIRSESLGMTQRSLGDLWEECIAEDQGDGLMVIASPTIPTAKMLERLHRGLPGELRQHNRTYRESAHIRLRVAVNVGPVASDETGVSGETIIRASRLLDAPVFKDSMTSAGAGLGIIVSAFVYDTAIRHAEDWADPDRYKPVEVNVKETRIPAWMQLIDG